MYQDILLGAAFLLFMLFALVARQGAKGFLLKEKVFALVTMGRASIAVTHDLNNLLQVIGTNVEFMRRANPPEEICCRINDLEHAFLCASRLTRHSVSLIRGQEQQPENVDLNAHLRNLEAVLRTLAGTSTDLVFEYRAENVSVCMRRSYLDQMLINLIVNSREAGSSRVEVNLAVRKTNRCARPSRSSGSLALLEIKDNGRGLSDSALKLATREFFTRGKAEGTGIGLATVERLAAHSGGKFAIQNCSTGGAKATIELPTLAEAA